MTALLLAACLSAPLSYADAYRLALDGNGSPTWRFILAVGVPAGDPAVLYAAPVYELADAPAGTVPGYYRVMTDARGVPVWTSTAVYQPMPVPRPPAAPPASSAPKAAIHPDCPECAALAKPQAVVVAPAAGASSSVTTTVRVRTTIRERFAARSFTPVRTTVGVVRRVVGTPVRVVRGVFGGGC